MAVSSRTLDPLAPPKFWETDGVEPSKKQIKPYSVEGMALAQYFRKGMPEDAELTNIYRVESAQPWQHYKLHRNEIYKKLGDEQSSLDGVEMYLWHGSDIDVIEQAVTTGFDLAHANMECNHYGAGNYFACDPRLAHFFCREARQILGAKHHLILARVAVGRCAEKAALPLHDPACRKKHLGCSWKRCQEVRTAALRKPENRKAPSGYHSCSSRYRTEVIVYKDFHAYPAYVFEYHCLSLTHFDPYRHQRRLLNFRAATQMKDFVIDFEAVRQYARAPHEVAVDETDAESATTENEAAGSRASHSCSQDRQTKTAKKRSRVGDRTRSLSQSSSRSRGRSKSMPPLPRRSKNRRTTTHPGQHGCAGTDKDSTGACQQEKARCPSQKGRSPSRRERPSHRDGDFWVPRSRPSHKGRSPSRRERLSHKDDDLCVPRSPPSQKCRSPSRRERPSHKDGDLCVPQSSNDASAPSGISANCKPDMSRSSRSSSHDEEVTKPLGEKTSELLPQQVAAPKASQSVDADHYMMAPERCVGRHRKGRGVLVDDRYAGAAGCFERLAEDGQLDGPAGSIVGWVITASGIHEESQEDDVFEAFAEFGDILNLHLNLDRRTGFVKGYTFIEYGSKKEAESAIRGMNRTFLLDSKLEVDWAFKNGPSEQNNVGPRDDVTSFGAPAAAPLVVKRAVDTISLKKWSVEELAKMANEAREEKGNVMKDCSKF